MHFEYVPLLQWERELYAIPRGRARFRAYVNAMVDYRTKQARLPIGIMNPMAKDHVSAYLDALLACDADDVARQALAEVQPRFDHLPGTFKVGLVVADDVAGGWTNRYADEYNHCFPEWGRDYKPGWEGGIPWLAPILWAADPPSPEAVREEVLRTVFRFDYLYRHGAAPTLREKMAQEGWVMVAAGCRGPTLEADDLEYTREVLAPYLDTTDKRTAIECLYGDAAGRTLGFTPRGLSHRAGLALALHDARSVLATPAAPCSGPA